MDDDSYIIDDDDYIIYDCEVLDDDDNAPVATLIRQGEKSTTRRVTSTLIDDNKPKFPVYNEDFYAAYQKQTQPTPQYTPPQPPVKTAPEPKPVKAANASSKPSSPKTSNASVKSTAAKAGASAKSQSAPKQTAAKPAAPSKTSAAAKPTTVKKTETQKSDSVKASGKTASATKSTANTKVTAVKTPAKSATAPKATANKAKASDVKPTAQKQTAAKSAKQEAPAKKMPVAAVKLPKDQQVVPKAPPQKPKSATANRANNLQSALGRANRANLSAVDTEPQRVNRYDYDPWEEIIINGKIVKLDSYNLAVNNNLENDIMAKEKATPATKKSTETVIIEGAQGVPHGKFVIKRTDNDNFVFKLFSANNKVVAISAGFYTSLSACKSGIQSVINNASIAPIEDQTLKNIKEQKCPKWIIYNDKRDEVRLRLIATNGNMVATTNDGYLSKDAAKKGIDAIARAAQGADVVRNDDLW